MLISVLSIIGTVLKWILFVILGIIAFLILVLVIICSSRFRYRFKGTKKGNEIDLKVKAGYLLSLFRVILSFCDKKMKWKVMVAWKQVAGSDMPDGEKKEGSAARRKKEREEKKFRTHGELVVSPESSCEKPSLKEQTDLLDRLEEKGREQVRTWRDQTENKKAQKEEEARVKTVEKAKRKAEKAEKRKRKADAKADGKAARARKWEELPDKVMDVLGSITDAILDGPDKIEDLLEEKVIPKYEKFEKYYRLFDKYPRKRETIQALIGVLMNILRPLMPKRYQIQADLGTGDPYQTALWIGRIYALEAYWMPRQSRRRRLDLFGDMENKVMDFAGEMRGRFSINRLLIFPLIGALLNRDIQRLIRFILKLRKKQKQKQKKSKQQAQGRKNGTAA